MSSAGVDVVIFDDGSAVTGLKQILTARGAQVRVSAEAATITDADAVIMGATGAFAPAMARFRAAHGPRLIARRLAGGRHVLAIGTGMSLLFSAGPGASAPVAGCDEWPGQVRQLEPVQVGWQRIAPGRGTALFTDPEQYYYFAHSIGVTEWTLVTNDRTQAPVVSWVDAATPRLAAVENGPLVAWQFRPEHSGPAGVELLSRWLARITPSVS